MKNRNSVGITCRVMAAMMGVVIPITLLLSISIIFKYELVQRQEEPPIILNMMALQVSEQQSVKPVEKLKPMPQPQPRAKEIEKKEKLKPISKPLVKSTPKNTLLAEVKPEKKEAPLEKAAENMPEEPILPKPVPVFKLTEAPQFLHKEDLVYPEAMRSTGKTGIVKLAVLIGKEGKVYRITVLESAGEAFDRAAKKAMMESTFMPAKVGNKSVAVELRLPVKFRLL